VKSPLRILMLEDHESDAELVLHQLRQAGIRYECERVDSKAEFLARLELKPDLILSDYHLPEFDGLSALELVRQRSNDTPFIIVSGSIGEDLAIQALQGGADDYVLKDRPARLPEAIRQAIERKASERALFSADAKFRQLVEQSLVGIYIIQDGRFAYVNPRMVEIFGYSQAELTSAPVTEFIAPQDRELARKNIDRRLAGETASIRYTLHMQRKDGAQMLAEVHGGRSDYNGRPAIMGTLLDVTEQRRAELALQSGEARHRAILESALDAVITIDHQGRILEFNPAAERTFGLAAHAVIGREMAELVVPPAHREAHRRGLARYLSTGEGPVLGRRIEITALHSSGEEFPVELAITRIGDSSPPLFTGFIRDIREAKRSERALRESEERFRQLAENIDEVFWMTTPDKQQMLYVSPAYERIWGRSCESLYQSPKDWLEAILPEDRARIHEAAITKQAAGTYDEEYRIVRPDGTRRWIRDRAFPVKDASGNILRFVGLAEDITERKNIERQVLRSQRVESLGTLASGIAHDLNNILAPILMSSTMLEEMFAGNKEAEQMIATINTSAQRGADVVRQILTFGRGVEGERIPLHPQHLAKDVLKMARDTFPKSISIKSNLPKELWPVLGDSTQLHQVLLNLFVNARDAIGDQGAIKLAAENVLLDTGLTEQHPGMQPGPHVKLEVADTGSGIPRDIMDKIFDPFFTTKKQGKGTGLGLSTVIGIVKSHGGYVTVYSEPGKGTTFHVYLPATPATAAEQATRKRDLFPRGQGQLVLVVDDEAPIRTVVERMLTRQGYRVVTAGDGAEGVAVFAQHRSEVRAVLTDLMMPNMDGVALVRVLRKINPKLPIIVASGLYSGGAPGREEELKKLGVEHRLGKPYSVEKLINILHELLKPPTEVEDLIAG
jgi:two-component system, cell cycle sensor histidine kinase and response regulator CckA